MSPLFSWTWKFVWSGKDRSPEPKTDQKWEMLGMETARYENASPEFWKEIGGLRIAAPTPGFMTRFEFIAVKIIDTPR
jgi:hypothetical protein